MLTALVIDDDEAIRTMMRPILKKCGYDLVDVARDGAEGVEKIGQTKYDLAIVDLMMPKMNGLDVLAYLAANKDPLLRTTIMMSAANEALLKPVKQYNVPLLQKPFDLPTLQELTRNFQSQY